MITRLGELLADKLDRVISGGSADLLDGGHLLAASCSLARSINFLSQYARLLALNFDRTSHSLTHQCSPLSVVIPRAENAY